MAQQEEKNTKSAPKAEISNKENKKVKELEKKVKEMETLIAGYKEKQESDKNDYLRLMAEFETFRRRTAEEKLNLVTSAAADTIKGLLPTLDNFERAIKMLENSSDPAALEGTKLIYDNMFAYLRTKGLAVIEAVGKDFDTDFHEAVAQFPVQDEAQKGKIIDVAQTGYTLNGKIIRYAKVVVGI